MSNINNQQIESIRKCNDGQIEISYYDNTEKKSFFRCVEIPKEKIKELQDAINDKHFD